MWFGLLGGRQAPPLGQWLSGSNRLRLVDEHDRYVVSDRIAQPAGVANEDGFGLSVLQSAFALGTNEDFE